MEQFDGNKENDDLNYEYFLKSTTEDYKKSEIHIENLESPWNIVYTSE